MYTHRAWTEKYMYVHTVQTESVFTDFKALISQKLTSLEASVAVDLSWEYKHTRVILYKADGIRTAAECEWTLWLGSCCTWDHAVQALDVLLSYAALCAHLVDEAGNEPDHRVGHVAVFRVLKSAFCVIALCDAPSNAVKQWRNENETGQATMEEIWSEHWEWCVDRNGFEGDKELPGISVLRPASISHSLLLFSTNVSHEMVMQHSLWITKIKSDEIQMSSVRNKKVWGKKMTMREKVHKNKFLAALLPFLPSH